MKRLSAILLGSCALLLAGCGTSSTNSISFDGIQMNIPSTYLTISTPQLDSYQIINKILKAYKSGTQTLIIARSALAAKLSPQEYATTSKEKLAHGIPGYQSIDDGSVSFTCGKEKIQGYTHSFSVSDSQGDNAGKTYIIQYYFIAQGTPYIISEADSSTSHYSDFTSMLTSLHCN